MAQPPPTPEPPEEWRATDMSEFLDSSCGSRRRRPGRRARDKKARGQVSSSA